MEVYIFAGVILSFYLILSVATIAEEIIGKFLSDFGEDSWVYGRDLR